MEDKRQPRKRQVLSPSEKIEARNRTDTTARQMIEDERNRRHEKSERLRQARLRMATDEERKC